MSITTQEIINLENLSKIRLTEEERIKFASEMSDVLEYIKEIQNVELAESDVEHIHSNVFKSDEVKNVEGEHIVNAIQNAPDHIGDLYKVSQVIKQ